MATVSPANAESSSEENPPVDTKGMSTNRNNYPKGIVPYLDLTYILGW